MTSDVLKGFINNSPSAMSHERIDQLKSVIYALSEGDYEVMQLYLLRGRIRRNEKLGRK